MGILRIVRMEFTLASVEVFDEMFTDVKPLIEAMSGCQKVELLKTPGHPQIRTTFSWWASKNDLNTYRKSDLFKRIWPKTKAKFSGPPIAWSVNWNLADGMSLGM